MEQKLGQIEWDHIRVEKKTGTQDGDHYSGSSRKKMNTLSYIARSHLNQIFEQLNKDDEVRVIIIKGEGDKAFTSGATSANFWSGPRKSFPYCTRT